MVAFYTVIMAALAVGLWLQRRPEPGSRGRWRRRLGLPGPAPEPGWARLIVHVAGTMVGGYLLLMAVVILYYYAVARVSGPFLESAFTGCAMLIALVTPVFFAASWLTERCSQRDRGGRGPARGPGRGH